MMEAGNKEAVRVKPKTAIKEYCAWCSGDNVFEVKRCPSQGSVLWNYRPGVKSEGKRRPAKAIREKCIDCSGTQMEEGCTASIKNCSHEKDCALWPFRFGKNPYVSAAHKAIMEERMASGYRPPFSKNAEEPETGAGEPEEEEEEEEDGEEDGEED